MDSTSAIAYKQANPGVGVYYLPDTVLSVTLGVVGIDVSTSGIYVIVCPQCARFTDDPAKHEKRGHY